MRRLSIALVVVGLAGCGDSENESTSKTTTTAGVPEPIAQMQEALRGLHSYHLTIAGEGGEGKVAMDADWAEPGRLRIHIEQAIGASDVVVTPEATYLRAGRTQWIQSNVPPKVADQLVGKWVQLPADKNTTNFVNKVDPNSLAYCAGVDVGTIRDLGVEERHGAQVHVLEGAGDVPGSAPGIIELATEGPAYPLRIEQTGSSKAGGTTDPRCDDGDPSSQTTHSVTQLSQFNEPVAIKPPADALTLEDVRALAQGESPNAA